MDRRALIRQAMQAAADLRDQLDLDQFSPVDPYRAAELLGVKVVFLATSMEGFYFKHKAARILLSSLRPVARRAFTCAHELGHHFFGHSSTIDQLQDDEREDSDKPDEVLANAFAAFFLMPSVGIRGAFKRRGWACATATPLEIFTIACQFGVGYATIINHLSFTLGEISGTRRKELGRSTPKSIRDATVGDEYDAITVVDAHNEATTFDMERGAAILLPKDATLSRPALGYVRAVGDGFTLYEGFKRGTTTVIGAGAPFEVRVMPKDYVGAAANRFLEDPDES